MSHRIFSFGTASIVGLLVASVSALVACGGSATPAASPSSASSTSSASSDSDAKPRGPEVATGNTLTSFQKSRLLGHYSTEDGASGFILDRTVTPWRAKLDGTNKVVTLAATGSEGSDGKDYGSADKTIWIRVAKEGGEVMLFQGPKQHEGVDIVRDADAVQLK